MGVQVRVRCIRGGVEVPVPVAEVVVGDILHMETGDKVRRVCAPLYVRAPLPPRLVGGGG